MDSSPESGELKHVPHSTVDHVSRAAKCARMEIRSPVIAVGYRGCTRLLCQCIHHAHVLNKFITHFDNFLHRSENFSSAENKKIARTARKLGQAPSINKQLFFSWPNRPKCSDFVLLCSNFSKSASLRKKSGIFLRVVFICCRKRRVV